MHTIIDVLESASIPHVGADHKHGRPGWVQVDCPVCGSQGKFHLGISLSTGASSCWRCGPHNTARILSMISGVDAGRIRARLDGAIMEAPEVRTVGVYAPPAGVSAMRPGHLAYLRHRGYDPAVVAKLWGVQGIGQAKRLSWRLFIPVFYLGRPVSWTTRSIRPRDAQRWISASYEQEAVHHKDILYGSDYARHAIIIHEGATDVWATGPGAVATCGTGFTEAQVAKMADYPVRVVCFDNGIAAQRRAEELANLLSLLPGATYNVQLETGEDPAEADEEELAELRRDFLDQ